MRYKIGDQVDARLGTLKVVGTVVDWNEGLGRYLVRFSAVQQDWYAEDELSPFDLRISSTKGRLVPMVLSTGIVGD